MNTSLLAFLGVGALFAPASSVTAPVQGGESRRASRSEMIDLRNRFGGAIDGIRANVEQQLLALDLSDPAMVDSFVDVQKTLGAFDGMAKLLPEMPDEEFEATRTSLKQLGSLFELQQRIGATASNGTGTAAAGACMALQYNSAGTQGFAQGPGVQGVILSFLQNILPAVYTTAEIQATQGTLFVGFLPGFGDPLSGAPALPASATYATGLDGERQAKELQSLLDYFSGLFPAVNMPGVGNPPHLVQVPHPLKLAFDIVAENHRSREVIKAEHDNAAFAACEAQALAAAVAGTALQPDVLAIKMDTGIIKGDTGILKADTGILKADTGILKADTGILKADTFVIRGDTGTIRGDTFAIRGDTGDLKVEMAIVKGELMNVKNELANVMSDLNARANAIDAQLLLIQTLILSLDDDDHSDLTVR